MPKSKTRLNDRIVRFSIDVSVIQLGTGYFAHGVAGGMQWRSNREESALDAVADLCWQVKQGNRDALLALDLALAGEDISDLSQTAADEDTPAIESADPARCSSYLFDAAETVHCGRETTHEGPHVGFTGDGLERTWGGQE